MMSGLGVGMREGGYDNLLCTYACHIIQCQFKGSSEEHLPATYSLT